MMSRRQTSPLCGRFQAGKVKALGGQVHDIVVADITPLEVDAICQRRERVPSYDPDEARNPKGEAGG